MLQQCTLALLYAGQGIESDLIPQRKEKMIDRACAATVNPFDSNTRPSLIHPTITLGSTVDHPFEAVLTSCLHTTLNRIETPDLDVTQIACHALSINRRKLAHAGLLP